jgi:hypothetical protein
MRYIIGIFVTIGLIVLLIVLLLNHGGSNKVPQTQMPLTSYANTDTTVRLTTDEVINAPDNHRIIRITVGRDNTTFELLQGYDGNPLNTQTFAMSENAYGVFLHALEHADFTKGNNDSSLKDERGYCPLGRRYIFEILQNDSPIERYWTTSCGGTPHTFQGNAPLVLQLFRLQVPGYSNLTRDVTNTGL